MAVICKLTLKFLLENLVKKLSKRESVKLNELHQLGKRIIQMPEIPQITIEKANHTDLNKQWEEFQCQMTQEEGGHGGVAAG